MTSTELLPHLERYFASEKLESAVFFGAGVLAVVVAVRLFFSELDSRALMYPLCAVGLIQLAVGASVGLRTDGQVAALKAQLGSAPHELQQAETARMTKVLRGFELYKRVEILLFTAGLFLALFLRRSDAWYWVGTGLVAQSAFMLVADLFAERRAEAYLAQLALLSS